MTIEELKRNANVCAVIAGHGGVIEFVNDNFLEVFGWNRNEIVGKTLATIIPTNLRDAHHLGFSRFLTTEKPTILNQPLKLRAVTKGGQEFDAEHYIVAERIDGQWKFGATIRPLQ